jgi:hypothetical protein
MIKIGKIWCFKYFFDDKEIFSDLLEYYNREKYRFEKYGTILKSSIDYEDKGKDRIFIMKDTIYVEDAIEAGAEKVV